MTTIHFHSDCIFFAGCENMLVNFFNHKSFGKSYGISFSYRKSKAYEEGFKRRVAGDIDTATLYLLDLNIFFVSINRFLPGHIRRLIQVICEIILMKYVFHLVNTVRLSYFFSNRKIDILYINNGGYPGAYSCTAAVMAAKLSGIKNIIYAVNNVPQPYNSISRILDIPFDFLVKHQVSLFVTGSFYVKRQLENILRLGPDKVINIPNGITPREITETKEEFLSRVGINENGRILLGFVAIIEKRKGHIYLLQALKQLKDERQSDMPFVIIEGSGTQLEVLRKFVSDNRLTEYVKFINDEKNIFNLLNAVDVVVLPSIANEDFPNIILEAMSLGKAIIATRFAGIPEQILHMESGVLVEPRDVRGLSEAIKLITNGREFRERIGRNALARFREKFHTDISIAGYDSIFSKLARKE